ncbi:M42 family metallopeptidase [Flexithrix dorotheae]|uniref:M42 family metallopeptidase n=1 Tax=Flexithrix dorotheae TaxID=70993 RepID=UPI000378A91E|nr:M42 family metallopeptidase [Flexithrix dorotheae]
MKINTDLLKEICNTPGAPGYESKIRGRIIQEIENHVDELKIDNIGNIIAIKKGSDNPDNKKFMLAAHMDEISFIVTHIDDNGFLKFHTLGGFDPKTLTSMRVTVHGSKDLVGVMGSKPIHIMTPDERNAAPKIKDFYIDLGLPKEEVEKYVEIGTPITRRQEFLEIGELVNGKSMDNRISVFILIEVLKRLQQNPYDVYAVFTVQEEVGIRGANVSSHTINPDFGLAIDVTIANDTPGIPDFEKVTELGKGTAIKVMDSATICDYRMVKFLKQTANKNGIKWQAEILTAGGTDTAGIQRMGKNGAIAGAISIPLRYVHQVIEMAHPADISASIELILAASEVINKFDWDHSNQ